MATHVLDVRPGAVLDRAGTRVTELWKALDEPVRGRRVPGSGTVALGALVVMSVVAFFIVRTGANLWYWDAQSHLDTARRIVDGKATGFQQLGTVWLPAPHLMLLPFVSITWLWYTGWSAALLGIGCFCWSSVSIYRITARLGLARWPRIVAVLVLWTNAAFLYMHTTALTEPVLIAAMLASAAGMVHWATSVRPMSPGEVAVYVGIPGLIAVLSRYEGWVLIVCIVLFMTIVEWQRALAAKPAGAGFRRPFRLGVPPSAFAAIAVPTAGILWWFAYNFAEFGNPVYFAFGPYSSFAQQSGFAQQGSLSAKGHLGLAFYVYNWSVAAALGLTVLVLGLLGFLLLAFVRGLDVPTLTVGVFLGTWAFELMSLYYGQAIILSAQSIPHGEYNIRDALEPLPFCALGTAYFVHYAMAWSSRARWKRLELVVPAVVISALLGQAAWWAYDPVWRVPIVNEGLQENLSRPLEAIAYLRTHYDGGDILLDEYAGVGNIMPMVQVPLSNYYTLTTGKLFDEAVAHPTTHVKWIFVHATKLSSYKDAVYKAMQRNPAAFTAYSPVAEDDDYILYERAW